MKLRTIAFLFLSLFSLSFIACSKSETGAAGTDGPITLALKTKAGDKQLISTKIDQHMVTKVMEQDLVIDQKIEMDMTVITKESKADTAFVLEAAFDRWAMKMDMGGAGISNSAEFDTKDSTKNRGDMANIMSQMFSKLIGQPFTMEMSRNGKVTSSNMKEVMAKIMPQGSQSSMNNDAFGTVPFPDHPVKPGDSWTAELERDFATKKTLMKSKYTLKEVKDGVAYLTIDGEVTDKGANMKLGSISGTFSIVVATGLFKDGEIKMKLDMDVDNPAGGKQHMNMDQTVKMAGRM